VGRYKSIWLSVLLHGTFNIIAAHNTKVEVIVVLEWVLLGLTLLYIRYNLLPLLHHHPNEPPVYTLVKEGEVTHPITILAVVVEMAISMAGFYFSMYLLHVKVVPNVPIFARS